MKKSLSYSPNVVGLFNNLRLSFRRSGATEKSKQIQRFLPTVEMTETLSTHSRVRHSVILYGESFGSHLSPIKISLVLLILILISSFGCLVFEKISYEISINEDKSGSAKIYVSDITSDATDTEAFKQDTSALFTFMLKSDEFIEDMKSEGRFINKRRLILNDNNLDAEVEYDFNNIAGVENIVFEDGFYYLTMDLVDSIITTNGEVIKSKTYKRILWDDKQKVLKFVVFSGETDAYRKLAPYYKKQE